MWVDGIVIFLGLLPLVLTLLAVMGLCESVLDTPMSPYEEMR